MTNIDFVLFRQIVRFFSAGITMIFIKKMKKSLRKQHNIKRKREKLKVSGGFEWATRPAGNVTKLSIKTSILIIFN